jgi:Right handed beta helix region
MNRVHSPAVRRTAALLGAAFVALLAFAGVASAATYSVNTTADQAPSPAACSGAPGDCSLRQAIFKADFNGEESDTIVVPAGHYGLTIEPGSEDTETGDLDITDGAVTIEGAGARQTIVDASAIEDRVFQVYAGAALALSGATVTGGRTEDEGGGIEVNEGGLSLDGVSVVDNEAFNDGYGGGIYVEEGELEIVDSTIAHNRNSGDGGGICAYDSEISIENSTIADNTTDTSLYPASPGWGAYGGGLEVYSGPLLRMVNVTISGNKVIDGNGGEEGNGAGIAADEFDAYEIANTIVFGNIAEEVGETGQCTETLASLGHNLEQAEPEGEPRCFEEASDLIADPQLGSLADNGGETDTVALASTSPAIHAGDAALCPPTDQRGVARTGGCDIGAFQYAPPAPPTPAPSPAPVPAPKGSKFGIKKIIHLRSKGIAKLKIACNGGGEIKLSGKQLESVDRRVAAGVVYIPVAPTASLKKKLMASGKVHVTARVWYTPDSGRERIKDKKVGLWLISS